MRAIPLLGLVLALAAAFPAAQAAPAPVTVTGPGTQPVEMSVTELRTLLPTQVAINAEHGAAVRYTGPLLWAVLQRSGAVEPDFHKRVRQEITVTGQDGYAVTLAMGEIDPEFENKPVVLATERDGTALDAPRLAVPGDKRAGRSVRDVASITIR